MKTLLLVRHAKSSWDMGVTDFERPLNDRGKKDAPVMAGRLIKRNIRIDAFVSSPAKRAASTAEAFAEKYGLKRDALQFIPALYHAAPVVLNSVVEELDDRYETTAIFAHNPGITEFANSLANVRIDDMPTCAIFAIQFSAPWWKEFSQAEKEFLFFDYPKMPGG